MRTVIFKCDSCSREEEANHHQAPDDWYTVGYYHRRKFMPLKNYCPQCGPGIMQRIEKGGVLDAIGIERMQHLSEGFQATTRDD